MSPFGIETTIQTAFEHHQAQRLPEAEALYRQILGQNPNNDSVLHMFGVLLAQTGRFDAAIENFRRAIIVQPNVPDYHSNLGNAFIQKNQYDEAILCCRRALTLNADFAEAHSILGTAHQRKNQLDEAIASYRRAVKLKPSLAGAYRNLGAALRDQGKFDDSIAASQKAIGLNPQLFEAHYNLGNAYVDKGQFDAAIAAFEKVLALKPDFAEARVSLAFAQLKSQRLSAAIITYQQALNLRPNDAETHSNLGSAFYMSGKLENAAACYQRAIGLKPDYADAYQNLGSVQVRLRKTEEAIANYRRALALKPNYPEALCHLGAALVDQGLFEEAAASCRRALALRPDSIEAQNNLALALSRSEHVDEAIALLEKVIAQRPNYSEAHANLGAAFCHNGRFDEAIEQCRRAVALKPDLAGGHYSLGSALQAKGLLEEAIASFRQAVLIQPDFADAHNNLGAAHYRRGRADEASACFRKTIALKPDHAEAHLNLSLALLLRGDLAEGFAEYEWRWQYKKFSSPRRIFAQPQWDGAPLDGRTILLHAEQGLGDTINFIRYVPLVAQRGGKIVIECKPELIPLLEGSLPGHRWIAVGEPLPPFDVHCPLMSLPKQFGTTLDTIPPQSPLLHANAAIVERWRTRVAGAGGALKVGLVWAGSKTHRDDHNRSLPLADLAQLGQIPNVCFFSLQKGDESSQANNPPTGMRLIDWTSELTDFAETAGLIANLDLVISVDTVVAHLAGAMGKTTWTLIPYAPDWRWLLGRDDSPWYPTMRLFRQPAVGDWQSAIASLAQQMQRWLADGHEPKGTKPPRIVIPAAIVEEQPKLSPSLSIAELEQIAIDHQQAGRYRAAEEACRRILAKEPDQTAVLHRLGALAMQQQRPDEAIPHFRRLIELQPHAVLVHCDLGTALHAAGYLADAIACLRNSLTIDPREPTAYLNLSSVFFDAGDLDGSLDVCEQLIAIDPNNAAAYFAWGRTAHRKGWLDQAVTSWERALQKKPNFTEAHRSIGLAMLDRLRLPDAIARLERAIAIEPNHARAHVDLALALFLSGDFTRGWNEFEWRTKMAHGPERRNFPQPVWDGSPLGGRTILLHAEQGFGDTLQFARYAPLVRERGGKVVVECQPELIRLLRESYPEFHWAAAGQPLPHFDVHAPLMSLPRIFGTQVNTIPPPNPPLRTIPDLIEKWRIQLSDGKGRLNIGLAWAGNKVHANDRKRSLPLESLAPLASIPGVRFISLQKGDRSLPANVPPAGMNLVDWTDQFVDFADTAALVANLDLVISVDTAIAHLAGAMNKPVWSLLAFTPDWRWLLNRSDTPWYPSMRLFRQREAGDWHGVAETVASELRQFVERGPTPIVSLAPKAVLPAKAVFRPATETAPSADSLFPAAIAHHQAGRLREAEGAYQRILAQSPNHAGSLHLLGALRLQENRPTEAVDLIRKAIALQPRIAVFHSNLGAALEAAGQYDDAAKSCRQAIALEPNLADAHNNLGTALQKQGRHADAIAAFQRALEINPNIVKCLINLSAAYEESGNLDAGMDVCERLLRLDPNNAPAFHNWGTAAYKKGWYDQAITSFERALKRQPDYADAHRSLGMAKLARGRFDGFDDAIACYQRAIELKPDYFDAHNDLGLLFHDLGRLDEAIACFDRALALQPNNPVAHFHRGLSLLLQGDLARGFAEYEYRWQCDKLPMKRRAFAVPQWDGRPLAGRTILLHAEQGYGDTIQFSRFIAGVERAGGKIIFECPPTLARLLPRSFGKHTWIRTGDPFPPFDVHCPLGSLPHVLGVTLATVPPPEPVLRPDDALIEKWRTLVAAESGTFKVGVAWAGNKEHKNDRHRSIPPAFLAPLEQVPGVRLFNLQLSEPTAGLNLIDHTSKLTDFAETAGLIANLDLVIAVDTAVAHLAGAMGKPVWTLLPYNVDWRWLLNREDSPWYPTMRLFRQKKIGDWSSVMERVAKSLAMLSSSPLPSGERGRG